MMLLCDAGLFSTGFLAQLATRKGMRSWVLRNALGKPYLDAAERAYKQGKKQERRSGVCLGYCSGTKTHDRDFARFAPTMLRLMEKNSRLELAILGHLALPAEFSRFKARIHRHAPVPWQDVPKTLASFDINLSPLEARNPFCRAKSDLKYFEAGILGIPTVATRIDEFEHAIRHGKNGFLVSDDEELESCLLELVDNKELRDKIGAAAREDVRSRYTPASRAQDLLLILREIKEFHDSRLSQAGHASN